MKELLQEITSKDTSVRNIPRLFGRKAQEKFPELFQSGNFNLDYGGGKYDDVTELLARLGVTNKVFDPFNRTKSSSTRFRIHLTVPGIWTVGRTILYCSSCGFAGGSGVWLLERLIGVVSLSVCWGSSLGAWFSTASLSFLAAFRLFIKEVAL